MVCTFELHKPGIKPKSREIEYYKTGIIQFDNYAGGIPKRGLTTLAGAAGFGKSMALMHMASNTAFNNKDKKVLYISCENYIDVDMLRLNKAIVDYNIEDNLYYINISELITRPTVLTDMFEQILEFAPDILFLDAPEVLVVPDGEEQQFVAYEKFVNKISVLSLNTCTVVTSWQLKNGCASKSIDEYTSDDLSRTIRVAQSSVIVYSVGKGKDNLRYLKVLKNRLGIIPEHPLLVQDADGKFNLKGVNE